MWTGYWICFVVADWREMGREGSPGEGAGGGEGGMERQTEIQRVINLPPCCAGPLRRCPVNL